MIDYYVTLATKQQGTLATRYYLRNNKNSDTCVDYFVPGQSSKGCVLKTASGQTCCVLNIER